MLNDIRHTFLMVFKWRSNVYEKIKKWYEQGLWKEAQIRQAVEKGVISEEECSKILSRK